MGKMELGLQIGGIIPNPHSLIPPPFLSFPMFNRVIEYITFPRRALQLLSPPSLTPDFCATSTLQTLFQGNVTSAALETCSVRR